MVVEVQSQVELRLQATSEGVTLYQAKQHSLDQFILIRLVEWDDFLQAIQGAYIKALALHEIEEKGKMD